MQFVDDVAESVNNIALGELTVFDGGNDRDEGKIDLADKLEEQKGLFAMNVTER